jgi:hypothetical protein
MGYFTLITSARVTEDYNSNFNKKEWTAYHISRVMQYTMSHSPTGQPRVNYLNKQFY